MLTSTCSCNLYKWHVNHNKWPECNYKLGIYHLLWTFLMIRNLIHCYLDKFQWCEKTNKNNSLSVMQFLLFSSLFHCWCISYFLLKLFILEICENGRPVLHHLPSFAIWVCCLYPETVRSHQTGTGWRVSTSCRISCLPLALLADVQS